MSEKSPSKKRSNRLPLTEVPSLIKDTFIEFLQRDGLFHGAALAYYALFAMVPLLYLSISFLGRIIGQEVMMEIISSLLQESIGIKDISGIMDYMKEVNFEKGSFFMEGVSIGVLLIASSAFLVSLKHSINTFFGLDINFSTRKKQFLNTLIFRLLSIAYVGIITVIIIILYFAQTVVMSLSSSALERYVVFNEYFASLLQHGFSILSNVMIFALVLKYVHNGYVQWKLAFGGAFLTSILLYLGQLLIKYYLNNIFFLSEAGFAGTLFIVLAWVYYTSQIIFFGAKFTAVYARKVGKPICFKE